MVDNHLPIASTSIVPPLVPQPSTNSPFEDYLLAEYKNIAEAHFRSIAAISSFFRYYLLIMALPVTLVSVFIGLASVSQQQLNIASLSIGFAVISFVISIVGYLVMLYIVNLRMDVVLYARAVNGIRKYFYDHAVIDFDRRLRTMILPQSPSLPPYREAWYFGPVIWTFGVFNASYLIASLALVTLRSPTNLLSLQTMSLGVWFAGGAFFVLHYVSYLSYAHSRERGYLRSYILGVDIDGVLNLHREQFAKFLKQNVGKSINPEEITIIPVHTDAKHSVSREDEYEVFNDTRYFIEMPPNPEASSILSRLRNEFNLKIHIFSWRAWPTQKDPIATRKLVREWEIIAVNLLHGNVTSFRSRLSIRLAITLLRLKIGNRRLGATPVQLITKQWLRANKMKYDKLTLERGNENVSDPQGHVRNRFDISRKKKIRFFVEDDAEKANKLAYICDTIFLYEHPYNTNIEVPANVIRVKSWREIYERIKKLS